MLYAVSLARRLDLEGDHETASLIDSFLVWESTPKLRLAQPPESKIPIADMKEKTAFELFDMSKAVDSKTAYRNYAKRYHPDVNKDPMAAEAFKLGMKANTAIEAGNGEIILSYLDDKGAPVKSGGYRAYSARPGAVPNETAPVITPRKTVNKEDPERLKDAVSSVIQTQNPQFLISYLQDCGVAAKALGAFKSRILQILRDSQKTITDKTINQRIKRLEEDRKFFQEEGTITPEQEKDFEEEILGLQRQRVSAMEKQEQQILKEAWMMMNGRNKG